MYNYNIYYNTVLYIMMNHTYFFFFFNKIYIVYQKIYLLLCKIAKREKMNYIIFSTKLKNVYTFLFLVKYAL